MKKFTDEIADLLEVMGLIGKGTLIIITMAVAFIFIMKVVGLAWSVIL